MHYLVNGLTMICAPIKDRKPEPESLERKYVFEPATGQTFLILNMILLKSEDS
jgi:hypothetical protein